jgi:hypothetical protein
LFLLCSFGLHKHLFSIPRTSNSWNTTDWTFFLYIYFFAKFKLFSKNLLSSDFALILFFPF